MEFDCVVIHIFGFYHKQCDSNYNMFLYECSLIIPSTFKIFSRAHEFLKHKTCKLLLWEGLLATMHRLCSIHITTVVKPGHFLLTTSRVSKSLLMNELLVALQYIFSAFTTSSVLAIKRTSPVWSLPSRCSIALINPSKAKCVRRYWADVR